MAEIAILHGVSLLAAVNFWSALTGLTVLALVIFVTSYLAYRNYEHTKEKIILIVAGLMVAGLSGLFIYLVLSLLGVVDL